MALELTHTCPDDPSATGNYWRIDEYKFQPNGETLVYLNLYADKATRDADINNSVGGHEERVAVNLPADIDVWGSDDRETITDDEVKTHLYNTLKTFNSLLVTVTENGSGKRIDLTASLDV